jgi:hypothetical protein
MSNAKEFMDSLVQGLTGKVDPAQIEIIRDNFKKKYGSTMDSTNEALNTPRTSTAPQSAEDLRESNAANTEAGVANFNQLYKPKAALLNGLAEDQADREVRVHGGKLDNHTRNVLAIQGGTGMDALRLGHSTGDGRHQREIDYRQGFNKDVLGVYEKALAQEQAQANRGFIKDLALTAGMLFMD